MVAFISSPIDTLLQPATRARAPGRTCTAVPTLPCKPNSRCDLRETKLAPDTRWGSRSRDSMRLPKFHGNYKADMVLDMLDPTGKDLSSGRRLEQKKIHEMGVTSITGMDDSLFVSGGVDGDLVISRWDGNLIKEVLRVPHANTAIDRIQVTADGNRICYLCRNEYAVRYLDWKKLVDELNSLLTR